MRPVLVHLGGVPIASHDVFVGLGVLVAALLFLREAERTGRMSEQMLWIAASALLGGAVGAKLAALWRYLDHAADPSLAELVLRGGRSILGGLAGAYAGAVLARRLVGHRRRTGDLFAPGVALGMAVGRWGCFLSEQVGTPTSAPWGLRLSPEAAARIPDCRHCAPGVALHPSFLYEIAFHAAMFAALWRLRTRVRVEGDLFKLYLLAYAAFRFLVEFVRGNETVWHGLTRSQLFLVPATLLLAGYFVRQRVRGVRAFGPAPAAATA